MAGLIEKLKTFFGVAQRSENEEGDLLSQHLAQIRAANPETGLQWLRLQRALASQPANMRPTSLRLIPRLALAAAIVVAALVGSYFYFAPREILPEVFATRMGEQTRVILADSSEVALNYASELTVPKIESGKARYLSLKGEAFFRVRRNETPFIVSTELADVQVVGTEFNVRFREGMLEVAVIHGIVNITDVKHGKPLTLTQSQRAICKRDGTPQLIENMPSREYPGWMHGKLFFDKATFADACREIEMRFDVVVRIDDATVQNEIVAGMLNAKDAESALTALCRLTGKRFQRSGASYRIY
jgi:ferric-dicitrate binding protein FerR (iron transport regulator)